MKYRLGSAVEHGLNAIEAGGHALNSSRADVEITASGATSSDVWGARLYYPQLVFPDRTVRVPAESRTSVVAPENRLMRVS